MRVSNRCNARPFAEANNGARERIYLSGFVRPVGVENVHRRTCR